MTRMSWADMHARRAVRSSLVERVPRERMVDVVGDVCGIHAQVMTAAEASIAARVDGLTRADVQAALWTDRTLVKASTLRGTLHLHPARELPLWMAAAGYGREWEDERWLAQRGMKREQADAVLAAIGDALDGRALTWNELGDEVVRRAGRWAARPLPFVKFGHVAPRWSDLLGAAASTGRLCYGPNRGRNVTFVRADQWIGSWEAVDRDHALVEVLRRYLRAYGPATPAEFAHWLAAPDDRARNAFTALGPELVEVDVEGYRAWLLAADVPRRARTQVRFVRLLPAYDCYVIGAGAVGVQRERLIPPDFRKRVFDRGAGPFPALVVDGTVAGVWQRRDQGTR
ncbi:MAG: winged helix DNA-binding domain-containing protein, partial [Chloroflexota bacterium]|nr:winged helix DNA-binding domain-containing protein [Chloroflexota bacterium]